MKTKLITIIITILILVTPIAILPKDINAPKVVALLSGGLLLLILFLFNYKSIYIDKKDALIIIFAILIFISTMLSSHLDISILGNDGRYEGMLALFSYIIIYMCSKRFFKYKHHKTLLIILYILYISVCTLGVVQYIGNYIDVSGIKLLSHGVKGTFGNTNFMGNFVSMGIPVFAMMYILKNKKISCATSLLVFFCIIACGARSAWVAFLTFSIILGAYLIQTKNKEYLKRTIILYVSFAMIFAGLCMAPDSFVRRKIYAMKNDATNAATNGVTGSMGSSRIQIWEITVELIKKYPIFGVGTDNLKYGIAENLTENSINYMLRTERHIDKAHNEYLQYAVTLGVTAMLVYLAFILFILKDHIKEIETSNIKLILYLVVVSYLVQAFFNISTIGIAPLFWFALGLLDTKENWLKI